MAGETYYFLFSLIFALGALLCLLILLLIRRGKTSLVLGVTLKPGTPEYKRAIQLTSNRNIAIVTVVTLILAVNLIYDVNRLMRLDEYPHGLLLGLTGFVIVMFIWAIPAGRKHARGIYELGRAKNKHD